jgi:hypothetical protein
MSENKDNSVQIYKKLKRFFLEREIANFYEYLNTLDKELNLRHQDLLTKIDTSDSNWKEIDNTDEHRNELINLKVESEQVKGFTNLLRQSFITSLYSFMELWLIRECHLDSKRRDGGKSLDSTEGMGLNKAKRYFAKVMGSNFPFGSSQDWQWIKNLQLLRDCIIHRQGSLTGFSDFDVNPPLAKFVKDEQSLSLFGTDNQQIFIEYEFCLKALQTIHRFMIELLALEIKTHLTKRVATFFQVSRERP